jgi:hypothetical protein
VGAGRLDDRILLHWAGHSDHAIELLRDCPR